MLIQMLVSASGRYVSIKERMILEGRHQKTSQLESHPTKHTFTNPMKSTTSDTFAATPLFEPLRLGPLTLRNRVFMAAMTRNRSVPTNVPNNVNLEHYQQRAKSAGLIISEGILITPQG